VGPWYWHTGACICEKSGKLEQIHISWKKHDTGGDAVSRYRMVSVPVCPALEPSHIRHVFIWFKLTIPVPISHIWQGTLQPNTGIESCIALVPVRHLCYTGTVPCCTHPSWIKYSIFSLRYLKILHGTGTRYRTNFIVPWTRCGPNHLNPLTSNLCLFQFHIRWRELDRAGLERMELR